MMPPYTMELRQGWETWLFRTEFTGGRWEDTYCCNSSPYTAVKQMLQRQYPDHCISCPEMNNMKWEDA